MVSVRRVAATQEILRLDTLRCGSRILSSGTGIPLHQSRRAMNIQFGRRVVTIQTSGSILSPSSMQVDVPALPEIEEAFLKGDHLQTDAFEVKLGVSENLQFMMKGTFDAQYAYRFLHPWIRAYDHSIAKAVLIHLYDHEVSCHGLEKDFVVKQERVLRESGSLAELAKGLLGIGYGLTPSGDDFILGMVAILHLQRRDPAAIRTVISSYENPFSRTILEDACKGHFAEPLLSLMDHLACGKCTPDAIEAVLSVGSTSGRDTLAGMYYALHQSVSGTGREGTCIRSGKTGIAYGVI